MPYLNNDVFEKTLKIISDDDLLYMLNDFEYYIDSSKNDSQRLLSIAKEVKERDLLTLDVLYELSDDEFDVLMNGVKVENGLVDLPGLLTGEDAVKMLNVADDELNNLEPRTVQNIISKLRRVFDISKMSGLLLSMRDDLYDEYDECDLYDEYDEYDLYDECDECDKVEKFLNNVLEKERKICY